MDHATTARPGAHPVIRRYAAIAVVAIAATAVATWWLTPFGWYAGLIAAASVVTLAAYGWDKRAAQSAGAERIPEVVLHGMAFLGGFPGGWLGRAVFHHKTRKPAFTIVLTLATALHLVFALWTYVL